MNFLIILLPPTLVCLVAFLVFNKYYSLKELGIHFGINVFLCLIFLGINSSYNMTDVQVINGHVTNKAKELVPCRHSYSCDCRQQCSGSGKDRHCWTVCDTCYEHNSSFSRKSRGKDTTWAVYSNVGGRIEINTLDRQGLQEPPRWTIVYTGEPYSILSTYKNYIKYNPDSLFKKELQDNLPKPEYPVNIYDYYRINRIINVNGVNIQDIPKYEKRLSEINAKLGPSKQVNISLVIAKDMPEIYGQSLEAAWLGGKKNNLTPIVNVNSEGKITWVYTLGFVKSSIVKVSLNDAILSIGVLDMDKILTAIEENTEKYYSRQSFKDFEYLKASKSITSGAYTWMIIVGCIISILLSIFFIKTEDGNE